MKIKYKILVYISTAVISILLIAFISIYLLFSGYREEGFQQHQNDKINTTLKIIEKLKDQSAEISFLLDAQDINDFYDEKLLIFNKDKQLIFESLDNLEIQQASDILEKLSPQNKWVETKEKKYDLIGVYKERGDEIYYGISKAYDAFGNTQLYYLRNILIISFLLIVFIMVLISLYIANMIAKPIVELESKIYEYELDKEDYLPFTLKTNTIEINQLSHRFNELLSRNNEVFRFQKNTINHISHQLKTPIAVLVSELEKIQEQSTDSKIKEQINQQKIKAKALGEIINVLLEISKLDAGQIIENKKGRIDELVFDCINELSIIYPKFSFEVNYAPNKIAEDDLVAKMNPILLKQAFLNLLSNCISYSNQDKAYVKFVVLESKILKIQFLNTGEPLLSEERKLLFKHLFRGENSTGKTGYGLGLMLTKRILELHNATILYQRENEWNIFEVEFDL